MNSVGANNPAASILAAVKERKAEVVALSITLPSRIPDLHNLIRSIRADNETAKVTIIVGGHPFTLVPISGNRLGQMPLPGAQKKPLLRQFGW